MTTEREAIDQQLLASSSVNDMIDKILSSLGVDPEAPAGSTKALIEAARGIQ